MQGIDKFWFQSDLDKSPKWCPLLQGRASAKIQLCTLNHKSIWSSTMVIGRRMCGIKELTMIHQHHDHRRAPQTPAWLPSARLPRESVCVHPTPLQMASIHSLQNPAHPSRRPRQTMFAYNHIRSTVLNQKPAQSQHPKILPNTCILIMRMSTTEFE